MDLYIGNATKQMLHFSYRTLGVPGERRLVGPQPIEPGTQQKISGDLSAALVESIIEQWGKYGIIDANSLSAASGYHGICYSENKPISGQSLTLVMAANHAELVKMGREIRRANAIAQSDVVQRVLEENGRPEKIEAFDMRIQQERDDPSTGVPQFSEGYFVTEDGGRRPQA